MNMTDETVNAVAVPMPVAAEPLTEVPVVHVIPEPGVLAQLAAKIMAQAHLFSARVNKDYLTIGIDLAEHFPELAKIVHMTNLNEDKFHAHMVPIAVVKAAVESPTYVAPVTSIA
jgi:hypothetical protein